MNHLLFTALLLALLYYFCYYLPQQKQITNPPLTKLTHSIFTQTEPTQTEQLTDKKELAELKTKHQALVSKNKDYQSQITSLQTQIRELVKRPCQPTNSKSTQTESETELTNTLDTLIKEIQNLNNSL
jgi:peptidoglycan hydrolase CwlO-like protein